MHRFIREIARARTSVQVRGMVIVVAALLAPTLAFAAGDVTVALTAQKVTKVDGHEVLASAEKAKPGEVLEYRAVYRNAGAQDARRLQATLPIPHGVEYLSKTAAPSQVLASVDGKTFAPVPLTRIERTPDGRDLVREIPLSEYRALRWVIGTLPAKQSRAVVARVRVTPVAVAADVR